jgi:hypothetical protein
MENIVDYQLVDFEVNFRDLVEFQFIVNINRNTWEDRDQLDERSFQGIEEVIDEAYVNIMKIYKDTEVVNDLDDCRRMQQNAAWAAMNVPYPRDPDDHMIRVVDNLLSIFASFRQDIAREMIKVNLSAHRIQIAVRECMSNPQFLACRRRLLNEFNSL